MKNSIKIGVLLIFTIQISFANTYYVSTSGNNSNSGTLNNPWKTIDYGQSQLVAGDILYVRGGTYVETVYISNSGTAANPIVISAYQNEQPIIDGQTTLPDKNWRALLTLKGSYIHVTGFEIKNSNITGTYLGGWGIEFDGGIHNKVSFMKIHDCWEQGIIAKADYATVEDCEVYLSALSNIEHLISSGWANGISFAREESNGITDHGIIRRCVVYNNHGEGIDAFIANNILIEDCISYDNWTMNIYVNDATNCLVQRNIVYNSPNSTFPRRDNMPPNGIFLTEEVSNGTSIPHSANNTIINNFLYNADLSAFNWTLIEVAGLDNVIIANNTIINGDLNVGSNDYNFAHINSQIKNNIITGSGSSVPQGAGLTFSNNNWPSTPTDFAAGTDDIIGDPILALSGSTSAGALTGDYFKLLSNSPTIQAGSALSEVTYDFFNNTRNNAPDIGGHEFSSTLDVDQEDLDKKAAISVFPNPNNGIFTLSIENDFYGEITIGIYNATGEFIYNVILYKTSDVLRTELNIERLATGIYYIKATSKMGSLHLTKKIIKN